MIRIPGKGARNKPSARPRELRRRRVATVIALLSLSAVGAGIYGILHVNGPFADGDATRPAPKKLVLEAWSSGDRALALDLARNSAAAAPLDQFYLTYRGIAAYYLATETAEGEERTALLDEAVVSLRKAMASGRGTPARAETEYVLGKAYYAKGEPWFDLAARFLEASIEHGYRGSDGEEYLAALYAGMEDHRKAVPHFEKALAAGRGEYLLLAAAKSYLALGDSAKAKALLDEAAGVGKDAVALRQAKLLLGDIAHMAGDLAMAERQYQSVLDTDPGYAEAWYRIGLIYAQGNDPVKARAAWRKAATLDPMHVAARQKLTERL